MLETLKLIFKRKETYVGITAAIAFQFIFFTVWLTAYDGVFDRTDELHVAVNKEDEVYGEKITKMLKEHAPFTISEVDKLAEGMAEMDERTYHMVIHIPDNLSETIQTGETAEINYYINQATPTLAKQMMETTATKMTTIVNEQVYENKQAEIAEALPAAVAAGGTDPELTKQLAEGIIEEFQQAESNELVKPVVKKTNNVEGFTATMIPLMVVLASYIGAMIMSQQLQIVAEYLKGTTNKWSVFFSRQLINIVLALGISILTLIIMELFKTPVEGNLFNIWLFQSLLFFSFLTISQMFVILFGNLGMIFNIILTAAQLVSAGAIVPRVLLSDFYQRLGDLLPATYGTNGYFSMIYGGGNVVQDSNALLLIVGITLLIAVIRTIIPFRKLENT